MSGWQPAAGASRRAHQTAVPGHRSLVRAVWSCPSCPVLSESPAARLETPYISAPDATATSVYVAIVAGWRRRVVVQAEQFVPTASAVDTTRTAATGFGGPSAVSASCPARRRRLLQGPGRRRFRASAGGIPTFSLMLLPFDAQIHHGLIGVYGISWASSRAASSSCRPGRPHATCARRQRRCRRRGCAPAAASTVYGCRGPDPPRRGRAGTRTDVRRRRLWSGRARPRPPRRAAGRGYCRRSAMRWASTNSSWTARLCAPARRQPSDPCLAYRLDQVAPFDPLPAAALRRVRVERQPTFRELRGHLR